MGTETIQKAIMAVSFMPASRRMFAAGDTMRGSTEEKVAAAETYIGYSGRYEVLGDKVVMHPEVSFFPNRVGVDQVFFWELVGNRLTLSTPPILAGGVQQTAHLVWERA